MEYLKQFIITLFMALVVREIISHLGRFSHWIVRLAAQILPTEEREDFIADNMDVIDAIEGPLSKLKDALGCFWAAACLINDKVARRTFEITDAIWVAHRPKCPAVVTKVWNPDDAAMEFPNSIIGGAKPPYIDGVVEVSFVGRDAFGREYPKDIGTVQRIPGDPDFDNYLTFDHHLGGGTFEQAVAAVRKFVEECKPAAEGLDIDRGGTEKMDEYRNAIKELSDPTPRKIRFAFLQDVFEISGSEDPQDLVTGVRNFKTRDIVAGTSVERRA